MQNGRFAMPPRKCHSFDTVKLWLAASPKRWSFGFPELREFRACICDVTQAIPLLLAAGFVSVAAKIPRGC